MRYADFQGIVLERARTKTRNTFQTSTKALWESMIACFFNKAEGVAPAVLDALQDANLQSPQGNVECFALYDGPQQSYNLM
jgi:hypothetical protein